MFSRCNNSVWCWKLQIFGVLISMFEGLLGHNQGSAVWSNKSGSSHKLLDDTVHSVHACGEDVDVTKSFTHNGRSYQEVKQQIDLAHGVMDSSYIRAYGVDIYVGGQRFEFLKSFAFHLTVWLCNMDTFGTKGLCRIMGYHWTDLM